MITLIGIGFLIWALIILPLIVRNMTKEYPKKQKYEKRRVVSQNSKSS